MSPLLMGSFRLIAAFFVINSSKELWTWSTTWRIFRKRINFFPKNIFQQGKTPFDKFYFFPYLDDPKLLRNLAIFDFESICLLVE